MGALRSFPSATLLLHRAAAGAIGCRVQQRRAQVAASWSGGRCTLLLPGGRSLLAQQLRRWQRFPCWAACARSNLIREKSIQGVG